MKGFIMNFIYADWDEIIKLPSQKEKLDKSFSEEYTPYYISKESYAATFGNDTKTIVCYLSTHNCCNCAEYQTIEDNRHYPCSHVYRLAYEIGLINKNGESIVEKKFSSLTKEENDKLFADVIDTIETNMSFEQQADFIESRIINSISKCVFSPIHTPFSEKKIDVDTLCKLGLLKICYNSNLGLIYFHGFRSDIISRLDENKFEWPHNLARTKSGNLSIKAKRDWCLAHPDETFKNAFTTKSDEYIMVRPSNKLIVVWKLVLQYFERKFYDTNETDKFKRYQIKHPTGATVTNHIERTFDFPQDIITKLLTQNGYNRCISLKEGIKTGKLYRDQQNRAKFCFTVKVPEQTDYELFIEPLETIEDFFDNPNNRDKVEKLLQVMNSLKQIDYLFDRYIDENFIIVSTIRSLISKHLKEESELKKYFESLKVIFDNGKTVVGYTKIISQLDNGHKIRHIEYNLP